MKTKTMTMTMTKDVLLISALMLAFSGVVRADGDGGDNSMSRWTGESYAAFQLGDYNKATTGMARNEKATEKARTEVATAPADRHATRRYRNPFNDDTAA